MNWELLDHGFWTTIVTLVAVALAFYIGLKQNYINSAIHRLQDTVELYSSYLRIDQKDESDNIILSLPFIHIQNVGTRLIYLDKYIFNGRIYNLEGQILPSSYSQAQNSFYRIQLPVNDEVHVSLEVFYHDLENRSWSSLIFAEKGGIFGWDIKTLPRKVAENN